MSDNENEPKAGNLEDEEKGKEPEKPKNENLVSTDYAIYFIQRSNLITGHLGWTR